MWRYEKSEGKTKNLEQNGIKELKRSDFFLRNMKVLKSINGEYLKKNLFD